MKELFVPKDFRQATLETIRQVNKVVEEYRAQGYDLTVRQVYYRLVAKDLIPNTMRSYKRLVNAISDGRKAGLIDWDMIVDRTRKVVEPNHWTSPADIIESAAESFRINKWKDQPRHVEVMVEKQALAGILEPLCEDLDINFTANRGYSSDSFMYRAGKRIRRKMRQGKEVFVLYLGDHDPSGLDMDRDILERLELFGEMSLDVTRLALLMEQINEMDVPENPAKSTDSRYQGYVVQFGESSWELDAVEPAELERLVTEAVEGLRDDDLWQEAKEKEDEMREELQDFADSYGEE